MRYLPANIQLERLRLQSTQQANAACSGTFHKATDLNELHIGNGVAGKVLRLSMAAIGCRQVQAALEEAASDEERVALALELKGHVCEAISSPHANFVVQKCIEVLPATVVPFIIDEVERAGFIWASKHKYGCRVIQRLIEFCPAEQVHTMVNSLFKSFLEVARHAYGTHVFQLLARSGPEKRRQQAWSLMEEHVEALVSHPRGGCGLLAAAMEHGEEEDKIRLAAVLRHSPHLDDGAAAWRAPLVARLREAVDEVNFRVAPTLSEPEQEPEIGAGARFGAAAAL